MTTDEATAREVLVAADRQVKVAIVMINHGVDVLAARAVLATHNEELDAALQAAR